MNLKEVLGLDQQIVIRELNQKMKLLLYVSFIVYISKDFRRFVLPLQTNAPMIHMLFNLCQRLIQDILDKFIIHENIMKTTKSTLHHAAELCELDLKDVVVQRAQCEFGAHVKSLLNKFDAH